MLVSAVPKIGPRAESRPSPFQLRISELVSFEEVYADSMESI
jgi:hypothetical protein